MSTAAGTEGIPARLSVAGSKAGEVLAPIKLIVKQKPMKRTFSQQSNLVQPSSTAKNPLVASKLRSLGFSSCLLSSSSRRSLVPLLWQKWILPEKPYSQPLPSVQKYHGSTTGMRESGTCNFSIPDPITDSEIADPNRNLY